MARELGINYSIRPNKNVERKLIFEVLASLEPFFPFGQYRYIGFGSLWFVDFVLAHRILGITKMISIQKGQLFERAAFNAPFGCITVEPGEASKVLPDLKIENGQSILWLDYEGRIESVLEELAALCERLSSGSILIVTINASKSQVGVVEEVERKALQEEAFRAAVGELAPAVFSAEYFDASKYPSNISATLLTHLSRSTRRAGREERFEPLFSFVYQDNAPMITVGGMIANATDRERLERAALNRRLPFAQSQEPVAIAVPVLTMREKLALDRLFPSDTIPSEAAMQAIGFPLTAAQLEAYRKYYKRYPVFGELIP